MPNQLFISLLHAAIWGQPLTAERPDDSTLSEVLRLTHIHGVGPLIYNELLRLGWAGDAQRTQMKQICMHNMLLQTRWEQMISHTWHALTAGGVQPVLLKGFGLASLYPIPYLRAWGDLDVWAGIDQYHQACGLLRQAFPEAKHHDEEWDELKHYCLVFDDGMAIELHRVSMDFLSPAEQQYWCALEREAMTSGPTLQVGDTEVRLPEHRFNLLFCFLHSWEHFCGTGIPAKQVADQALLCRQVVAQCDRRELDTYLLTHLRRLHMLQVWQTYGYMLCRLTGLPTDLWPLYSHSARTRRYGERLYRQVLSEGQCRQTDFALQASDRYEARDKVRQLPVWQRKLLTLHLRNKKAKWLFHFAPRYAWHEWSQQFLKGLYRTIHRQQMINY